jgi:hypothetical protein
MRENSRLTTTGALPMEQIGYEMDAQSGTLSITYDFRGCVTP